LAERPAFFEIPRNRGKNPTLLRSLYTRGMGPSMTVQRATTARVFETYVQRLLAPTLKPGQVVVMDKLGEHRPMELEELIEQIRAAEASRAWIAPILVPGALPDLPSILLYRLPM
jgi:DDE superfamily endonuclease